MNLTAINRVELLGHLGYPVLLATSRKSVIGLTLDLPGGSAPGRHPGDDSPGRDEGLRLCAGPRY